MNSTPENTKYLVFRILFAKNIIAHNPTTRDPKFLAVLCFSKGNVPEIEVCFFCLRFRKNTIERVMDLTDSFTWEDMRTKDSDTGHLTAAGWIPFIIKNSRSSAVVVFFCHIGLSTIRIVRNHETIFIVWYPFDWTVSPFYELVNILQVTLCINVFSSISSYNILNLMGFFNWQTLFYFISLHCFRSVVFHYFSPMFCN